MSKILLISEDESLLNTRAAVLKRTNAEVIKSSGQSLSDLFVEGPIDLVVICHGILEPRREIIYGVVRRRWPGARILQVVPNTLGTATEPNSADGVAISGYPEKLIARAFELLGH